MTLIPTLNKKNYLQLLAKIKIVPKIIETEAEYEEYLGVTESLIAKKDSPTPEETANNRRKSLKYRQAYFFNDRCDP